MLDEFKYLDKHFTLSGWEYTLKKNWKDLYFSDVAKFAKDQNIDFFEALNSFYGVEEKRKTLPSYLYKFYKPTIYNLADIINGQVYLSNISEFNDVFDSVLSYNKNLYIKTELLKKIKSKVPKDIYDKFKSGYTIVNSVYSRQNEFFKIVGEICNTNKEKYSFIYNLINELNEEFQKKLKTNKFSNIGIACFTSGEEESIINNSAMWGYYADNAKGFCVRYDISGLKYYQSGMKELGFFETNASWENFSINNKISACLYKVAYSSRRPVMKISDSKKNCANERAFMESSLTKSTAWSKEKEYRLISNLSDCHIINNKIKFPYFDRIYFGPRMEEGLKVSLTMIFDKLNLRWSDLQPSANEYAFIEDNHYLMSKMLGYQYASINKKE